MRPYAKPSSQSFISSEKEERPRIKSSFYLKIAALLTGIVSTVIDSKIVFEDKSFNFAFKVTLLTGKALFYAIAIVYLYSSRFKCSISCNTMKNKIFETIFALYTGLLAIGTIISKIIYLQDLSALNDHTVYFLTGFYSFWEFMIIFWLFHSIRSALLYAVIVIAGQLALLIYVQNWSELIKMIFQSCFILYALIFIDKVRRTTHSEKYRLKTEEKFYKSMLNSLPEAILVLKPDGDFKFRNSYMKKLFNWNTKEEASEFFSCFSSLEFIDCVEDYRTKLVHSNILSFKGPIRTTSKSPSLILLTKESAFKEKIKDATEFESLVTLFQKETKTWSQLAGTTFLFSSKYNPPMVHRTLSIEIKAFVLNEDNQPQLILVFRDTTDRDKIAGLEKENEVYRNNVIASFSHELRTPLNSNLGLLEQGMLRTDVSLEAKNLIIEPALVSAKLLLCVINDILDYSQLLNEKFELKLKPTSVPEIIENCLVLATRRIETKNLKLEVNIQDDTKTKIHTDAQRLSQILMNLINNALKFTFKGTIRIEYSKSKGSCYKVSVMDTGIGMDEDAQRKLRRNMEIGKGKEGKISANTAGVGLGLFMSNAFCYHLSPELSQGLFFESEKNKGSKFYFYLKDFSEDSPLRQSEFNLKNFKTLTSISAEKDHKDSVDLFVRGYTTKMLKNKLTESNTTGDTSDFTKYPILIVDDEVFNLLILEQFCASSNFTTEKAFNGKEALEKVQEIYAKGSKVKLVLIDVNMPIMDGYETTLALRKKIRNNEIENLFIVGITAYVAKEKIDKCYECGMDEVVNKPLSKAEFQRLISKYCGA